MQNVSPDSNCFNSPDACVFSVGGADKRGAGTQGGAEDSGQDHRPAHVPTPAATAAGTNGELVSGLLSGS